MAHYKQDNDIKAMTQIELRRELARVRHRIKVHQASERWGADNDLGLYRSTLPNQPGVIWEPGQRIPHIVLGTMKRKEPRRNFQVLGPGDKLMCTNCPHCGDPKYNGMLCKVCQYQPQ